MVCVEPLFPTTRGSHFHEISPTITFYGFIRSYIFVPPSRRKCIPPRCGSALILPIPQDGFGPLDFSSDILREFNFGTEFDFGREFSFEGGGSWSVGSFEYNLVSVEYFDDGIHCHCCCCHCCRRQRPNCMYCIESVKTSCWYREFLQPGPVRDLTCELSSLDRYLEFCDFFRMPLTKVDELVDVFIWRGCLHMPRSLSWRAKFCERAKLLVMSALYILGKGASFRCCCTLTHISTSEVCEFFFDFLDAMVDMKDEYIFLPENIAALACTMKLYESIGLPGACGSMDVFHVKRSNCPAGDYNRAKGKEDYPTMAFQCITDYNCCFLAVCGPQFGTQNNKEIVKLDPNKKMIHFVWFLKIWWRYYQGYGWNGDGERSLLDLQQRLPQVATAYLFVHSGRAVSHGGWIFFVQH
jgi:hypothetical protein